MNSLSLLFNLSSDLLFHYLEEENLIRLNTVPTYQEQQHIQRCRRVVHGRRKRDQGKSESCIDVTRDLEEECLFFANKK